jgi:formyltetrahydrofolate deformylase
MSFEYILKISCRDAKGIVAKVSGFITEIEGFIIESAQFGDLQTNNFFMRILFSSTKNLEENGIFEKSFKQIAGQFNITYQLFSKNYKARLLIMASKETHCLTHLLYKIKSGSINASCSLIISNHTECKEIADFYNIPFIFLPITKENKQAQENELLKLIEKHKIDLVVLARYMQILSNQITKQLYGKIINIHHSFLPSFKGANPYNQAYERGVKLIGATAHYVNEDLDEGPIIWQEVSFVNHSFYPNDLKEMGKDIETKVLFSAVKAHTQHKTFINNGKTIVF